MLKTSFIRVVVVLALLAGVAAFSWPGGAQAAPLGQTDEELTIAPSSNSRSGLANTSVTYQITASLADTAAGPVSLSASVQSGVFGASSISPTSISLEPGDSFTFTVLVNIPSGSSPGSSDTTVVTFTWAGTPRTVSLTTTVSAPPTVEPTTPPGAARPLVVVSGYYLDQDTIAVGDSFKLFLTLKNQGTMDANNLILSFVNESFLPQETGGVVALGSLEDGAKRDVTQRFLVSAGLYGQSIGTVPVNLTYTDANGTSYTEAFSITLQLRVYSGAAAPTATPTLANIDRPQMVVSGYQTDVDPLQPGLQFSLDMDITNLGNANARAITMVLGGGVTTDPSGTPQPGGVSGGSGDLTNFAPVGSSNLVYLGDLNASGSVRATMRLIVNVTANPGAYPLKISFVYTDPKGNRLVDDQVITLLIYQLPLVEVNYYRDPGPIFSGQMATLPLQVVNLGRKTAVLGNMTVTAPGLDVQNNTILVGALDPGGSYTLDASLIPLEPGSLDLNVTINYTDDFNQPRQVVQTLNLNVQDGAVLMPEEPGLDGSGGFPVDGPVMVEETFWQKALRFVKGLVGLDSAQPQPGLNGGIPIDKPVEEPVYESAPVPAKGP